MQQWQGMLSKMKIQKQRNYPNDKLNYNEKMTRHLDFPMVN